MRRCVCKVRGNPGGRCIKKTPHASRLCDIHRPADTEALAESEPPVAPPTSASAALERFAGMLRAGVPEQAVRQGMSIAEVPDEDADAFFATLNTVTAASAVSEFARWVRRNAKFLSERPQFAVQLARNQPDHSHVCRVAMQLPAPGCALDHATKAQHSDPCLAVLHGNQNLKVAKVQYVHGSNLALAGSTSAGGSQLKIWDVGTSVELGSFEFATANVSSWAAQLSSGRSDRAGGKARCIDFLLLGTKGGEAQVWDYQKQSCAMQRPVGGGSPVEFCEFLGESTVVLGSGTVLQVWNWCTGACLQRSEHHSDAIRCGAVHSECAGSGATVFVFSGGKDATVRCWNVATNEATMVGTHGAWVLCMALSGDNSVLATGGADKVCKVWRWSDITTAGPVYALSHDLRHMVPVISCAVSNDAHFCLTGVGGGGGNALRCWDLTSSGALHTEYTDLATTPFSCAFPDHAGSAGTCISSDGPDCKIWDLKAQPRQFKPWDTHPGSSHAEMPVRSVFVGGGLRHVVSHGSSSKLCRVSRSRDQGASTEVILTHHCAPGRASLTVYVACSCVSASGKLLLTGASDGMLRLWRADTGALLSDQDAHNHFAQDLVGSQMSGQAPASAALLGHADERYEMCAEFAGEDDSLVLLTGGVDSRLCFWRVVRLEDHKRSPPLTVATGVRVGAAAIVTSKLAGDEAVSEQCTTQAAQAYGFEPVLIFTKHTTRVRLCSLSSNAIYGVSYASKRVCCWRVGGDLPSPSSDAADAAAAAAAAAPHELALHFAVEGKLQAEELGIMWDILPVPAADDVSCNGCGRVMVATVLRAHYPERASSGYSAGYACNECSAWFQQGGGGLSHSRAHCRWCEADLCAACASHQAARSCQAGRKTATGTCKSDVYVRGFLAGGLAERHLRALPAGRRPRAGDQLRTVGSLDAASLSHPELLAAIEHQALHGRQVSLTFERTRPAEQEQDANASRGYCSILVGANSNLHEETSACAIAPDGRAVVLGGALTGSVYVWDALHDWLAHTVPCFLSCPVACFRFPARRQWPAPASGSSLAGPGALLFVAADKSGALAVASTSGALLASTAGVWSYAAGRTHTMGTRRTRCTCLDLGVGVAAVDDRVGGGVGGVLSASVFIGCSDGATHTFGLQVSASMHLNPT
jgi:WD40 repeat protein